ncbi:MAG: non-ribosomal peptide synthetase, partial [Moorea sp. SIO3E2]|nr:non-ribosomal peptide synthetase [Moorena sp. SIO3E2]
MSDLLKRLENIPLHKRELVLKKLRQKPKKSVIEKVKQNPSIKPVSREKPIPLSFAQTRLWFLDRLEEQSSHYNVPLYLELKGDLNPDALTKAITEIIQRHEVLRTNFRLIDDQPVQIIRQNAHINLPIIDLDYKQFSEQIKKVNQLAKEELQQSFNLEHDNLLRGKILRLNHQYHILLLVMHHIVGDAWSMGIFTRELSTLYESYCTGTLPSLPKLAIQ